MDYLLPPVIGALIGYSTNWLAIKMIFRPFEPKYILGKRVPFTPGLIPRNREEIAMKIGLTITSHLISPEKLYELFDNQNFRDSLQETINSIVDKAFDNILENLEKQVSQETSINFIQNIVNSLSERIKERIKPKLREILSENVEVEIERYLKEDFIRILQDLKLEELIYSTLMEVDIQTLENIVLGFSKRQLNYITNLGGVIGFFVGVIQFIITELV